MLQNNETHRLTPCYLSLVLVMMMMMSGLMSSAVGLTYLGQNLVLVPSVLLYVHKDRMNYPIRDGEPRTSTSTSTQLLSSRVLV